MRVLRSDRGTMELGRAALVLVAALCAAVLLRPCLPHPLLEGAVPYALAFVALCPVFLSVLGLVWARRWGGC